MESGQAADFQVLSSVCSLTFFCCWWPHWQWKMLEFSKKGNHPVLGSSWWLEISLQHHWLEIPPFLESIRHFGNWTTRIVEAPRICALRRGTSACETMQVSRLFIGFQWSKAHDSSLILLSAGVSHLTWWNHKICIKERLKDLFFLEGRGSTQEMSGSPVPNQTNIGREWKDALDRNSRTPRDWCCEI